MLGARGRACLVTASICLAAAVCWAENEKPQGNDNTIPWNLTRPPTPGHTGKVLIRPDGQLHEGPGNTGDKSAAYHFHRRDPVTGKLDPRGVPVRRGKLDDIGRPAASKRWTPEGRDIEKLVQDLADCLASQKNVFSRECRDIWDRFVELIESEIEWADLQCREKSDPQACEQLRRLLKRYLYYLEKRLKALEDLWNAECQNPATPAKKAWCDELAREIDRLREKIREVKGRLRELEQQEKDRHASCQDIQRLEIKRLENEYEADPNPDVHRRLSSALGTHLTDLREFLYMLQDRYDRDCEKPPTPGHFKAGCEELMVEIEKVQQEIDEREEQSERLVMLPAGIDELVRGWAKPIDETVEQALLAERWAEVNAKLAGKEEAILSPLARLALGHAYLATNKNNESVLLFWSCSLEPELKAWEKWTADLVRRHSDNPAAYYIHGDALARLQEWEAAVAELSEASTGERSRRALALNARGVCYAALGRWNEAIVDLEEATTANPSLADAFASRGTLNVQMRDGAEGGLNAFETALRLSPKFTLAVNGQAAVRIVLGEFDEAEKDLEAATKQSADQMSILQDLVGLNAFALANARNKLVNRAVGLAAKAEPGMTLERAMKQVHKVNLTIPQAAELKGLLNNATSWNRLTRPLHADTLQVNLEMKGGTTAVWGAGAGGAAAGALGGGAGRIGARTNLRTLMPLVGGNLTQRITGIGGGAGAAGFGAAGAGIAGITRGSAGAGLNLTFHPRRDLDLTLSAQQTMRQALDRAFPNVAPTKMNSLRSFMRSRSGLGHDFTHPRPGGVSTEEIENAPIESGDWEIVSTYGLLYRVPNQPEPVVPTGTHTPERADK